MFFKKALPAVHKLKKLNIYDTFIEFCKSEVDLSSNGHGKVNRDQTLGAILMVLKQLQKTYGPSWSVVELGALAFECLKFCESRIRFGFE